MTLTVRVLGVELLSITVGEELGPEACDVTTYPVGFVQREHFLTDGRYGFDD